MGGLGSGFCGCASIIVLCFNQKFRDVIAVFYFIFWEFLLYNNAASDEFIDVEIREVL